VSCGLNLGEMILQSPRAHGSAPLRSAREGAASEDRKPRGEKSSPSHGENSPLFNLHDTLPSAPGRTCR
jgi:hypothetical protein